MNKTGLLLLLVARLTVAAQVSVKTNLLHTIPINKALTFEVRISKGNLSNFSRYQLEVPEGVVLEEVESKTGTFSFEENKAKIIWVVTPSEPEFGIRMKVKPVRTPQTVDFIIKYYFIEQDEKREFEAQPYVVSFKDTTLPVFMSAPMVTLISKVPAAPVATPVDLNKVNTKDPEKLKQQVAQLRKDSKEAFTVGEREKGLAQEKLNAIAEEEKKLADITNEDEKKAATEKLQADKKKAEDEVAIAERVLTLAKSLEENANEIDRINRSVNPNSFKEQGVEQVASENLPPPKTETEPVPVTTNAAPSEPEPVKKEEPVTKTEQPEAPKKTGNAGWGDVATFAEGSSGSERVYMVQVGAFRIKPAESQFSNLGKITIRIENEIHKVLVGRYLTKEEAAKKRAELASKGVDSFVVTYEGSTRVK